MHFRPACWLLAVCLLPAVAAASEPSLPKEPSPEAAKFFEHKVRPLLVQHCQKCHGPDKQKGELRVDSLSALMVGGESGAAVVPGKVKESLLIEAINYESYEMPPTGKLDEATIATLTKWVEMGAPWPGASKEVPVAGPRPKITDEDRQFWSFQPIRRPTPPQVDDQGWSRGDIDRFIFARLTAEGLKPAPEADRRTLIRRLYFDLVGLPPRPEEVSTFANDEDPKAYEKLVEKLLASPHYGERWARHWLDIVRYAESDGYRQDAFRPYAWRYRDYVIQAFNADKPYDRFLTEQLAGDEIAPEDPEALVATGFLRHGMYEYNQRDVVTQWDELLNEVTDVTGDVFLGLGIGCARCHDHKFDPILQKDYYRLRSFFAAVSMPLETPIATPSKKAEYAEKLAAWEAKTADIRAELAKLEEAARAKAWRQAVEKFPEDVKLMFLKPEGERSPYEQQLVDLAYRQVVLETEKLNFEKALKGETLETWKKLQAELAKFDGDKPAPLPVGQAVCDIGCQAPVTSITGDKKAEPIAPGFLTILDDREVQVEPLTDRRSTGRRTALAAWFTSPDHPLTSRVMVNRIWQYHFGRGLVSTASDYGRLGEKPSHPELLDWLATEFVKQGWSIKAMHRQMVLSSTYRQAALHAPSDYRLKDPENRLRWKMVTRRLDAEQIRDAILATSGELDLKAGGSSVEAKTPRRSVYVKVLRNTRDPLLAAFDVAEGIASLPERNMTTTSSQALLMMNASWILDRAKAFARRVDQASSEDPNIWINTAYRYAYGRDPRPHEAEAAARFIELQTERAWQTQFIPRKTLTEAMPKGQGLAAVLDPETAQDQLVVPDDPAFPAGDFTVEARVLLRSLFPDANVRTIAAQWDSHPEHPGWSLGVTSTKSKYQPRNVILQLVGKTKAGGVAYEVIPSNIHLELDRPYYVSVTVKIGEAGPAGVRFTVQDLTKSDPPQIAEVAHTVLSGYRAKLPLVIGGRDGARKHSWHGLIDEVRLSANALPPNLLLSSTEPIDDDTPVQTDVVGHWTFDDAKDFYADKSGSNRAITKLVARNDRREEARMAALVDFCHALLMSNEFLYVD